MKSENWIKDAIFSYLGRTATISFFMLVGFLAGYNQKISHMREFVLAFNNRDWAAWIGAFIGTWLFVMMIYTSGLILSFILGRVTLFISQRFRQYQATEEKRKNDELSREYKTLKHIVEQSWNISEKDRELNAENLALVQDVYKERK